MTGLENRSHRMNGCHANNKSIINNKLIENVVCVLKLFLSSKVYSDSVVEFYTRPSLGPFLGIVNIIIWFVLELQMCISGLQLKFPLESSSLWFCVYRGGEWRALQTLLFLKQCK